MVRLRRVSSADPGWTRRRAGRGFTYLDERGERLPDEERRRVRELVIPPAWEDVWICPFENGHLQAVGTDQAGRRQYIYHPEWRSRRDAEKFRRVARLGAALPRVRARVTRDLRREQLCSSRACALAIRLLDLGCFRIGSDVYADEHGSFGLTTLERRHLHCSHGTAVFEFSGKSGVDHVVTIDDADCVAVLRTLKQRRGAPEALLGFPEGRRWRRLEAEAVNNYVREITGLDVTAKDFRTWHATVAAARALAETESGTSRASRKRAVSSAMREVADYLGNTPVMARTSYVDPRVLDHFRQGHTIDLPAVGAASQRSAERALLRMLE